MVTPPKLPRVNLDKLDASHSDFVKMFWRFSGEKLTSELCKRIAWNVEGALEVSANLCYQTLMQYEGKVLDSKWCALLARQLVARQDELDVGVLQLFDRPIRDEWVALEIYKLTACQWRDHGQGMLIDLYCLTGHPAGHTLKKKFPEGWLSFLAYRIGYSRTVRYEHDPQELVGLRFWGYLLAARRDPNDLDFEDWKIDVKLKRDNQSILRLRHRFDVAPEKLSGEIESAKYSCPIDSDNYCSQCECSVDSCRAAYNRERMYVDRVVGGGPSVTR